MSHEAWFMTVQERRIEERIHYNGMGWIIDLIYVSHVTYISLARSEATRSS